ncbi:MAG: DUF5666 domain-containing protein [Chloroflexota bacterium]
MKRKLKLLLIPILGLAVIAGSVTPVLAMSHRDNGSPAVTAVEKQERARKAMESRSRHEAKRLVKGTVASVSGNTITLTSGETVVVNEDTRFLAPPKKDASLADVTPGSQILAHLDKEGAAAKQVMVMPERPALARHVGTVTAYAPGASITIETKRGETATFVINADTRIVLPDGVTEVAVGDVVTVVGIPGTDPVVARQIVVHPDESDLPRERVQLITGTITALGAGSLTVKPDDADEVAIGFNEDTIFVVKGSPALSVGQQATVLAWKASDGDLMARAVLVGIKPPFGLRGLDLKGLTGITGAW